ncbi:MAG: CehA/McbA family metallohydrolase [Planctomycetota bacterium]|jgi:hypothetical protein
MRNSKSGPILTAAIVLTAVFICPYCVRADTGRLSVTVHEPGEDMALPCRAWVEVGGERLFNPVTQSCKGYKKDRSFSCDGHFVIEVPAGKAVIHIERGKEYRSVNKEVIVRGNQTTKVNITLRRWVNMREQGWYSADMHCHFGVDDLGVLKQTALADDINFEPVLSVWNHQKNRWNEQSKALGYVWPAWPEGSSFYADATHLVTLRNEEIERIGGDEFESVGALLMFGLTRPVKVPPKMVKYPCDAVLGRRAKTSSPGCVIDTDKPIWGENVVGMALGLFDSVQVCHNHYHRANTVPIGWGMAGDDFEQGEKEWGKNELFHRTNSTYYRFLNCGFRLAVTGGTAMGVMPAPLGYCRTYAKLEGGLTEANYLKAILAGRTFATSGPMLILTANGLDSGGTIQYAMNKSEPIRIKAELQSIEPLDSLELIYNGKVVKQINLKSKPPSPLLEQSIELTLEPERSGWVAARAVFTAVDGYLRQAHTSPVYITVDGKKTVSKKDAEYMIRWIDRVMEVSEKPGRYPSDKEREQAQGVFREARRIYRGIAETAVELWGDKTAAEKL